ncbi:MAG: DUF4249 domain-containing protein [Cyclobacteriaceae bacterium]
MKEDEKRIFSIPSISKIIVILGIILTASCEVVVDVPTPNFKPSLVLNSYINPDSIVTLALSSNRYVLDTSRSQFPWVDGALIKLYEDGLLVEELQQEHDISGYYFSDFHPKTGSTYLITAEKEGFEPITASTSIPSEKANFSIIDINEFKDEFGYPNYKMRYNLLDKPGNDFYEVRLFQLFKERFGYYDEMDNFIEEESFSRYDAIPFNYFSPEDLDTDDAETYDLEYLFSDQLFEGRTVQNSIEFHPFTSDNEDSLTFQLRIRKVSEEYYEYRITSDLQFKVDGNAFAEPIPVFNNIENGFGIFSGYNRATRDIKLLKNN